MASHKTKGKDNISCQTKGKDNISCHETNSLDTDCGFAYSLCTTSHDKTTGRENNKLQAPELAAPVMYDTP